MTDNHFKGPDRTLLNKRIAEEVKVDFYIHHLQNETEHTKRKSTKNSVLEHSFGKLRPYPLFSVAPIHDASVKTPMIFGKNKEFKIKYFFKKATS